MKTIFRLILFNFIYLTIAPQAIQSQVDFREETIYFLLTSRFNDGDSSNNAATEWSSYNANPEINPSITDPEDVTWRGDFKGLIEKLDYIKDLGFTAIWVTPIVHNRSPLDYHGYHAWDFTKVDPRLESPDATFQDLINEVHAKGMKIVLDVVTNHAGRFGIKDVAEIKYNTDPTAPWFATDNPNWEYDGITPNPDDGLIWSRANLASMPAPYNQNLEAYNFPGKENYVDTSDPNWYHHSGNGFAQGFDDTENLYNRALAGDTPDLNTSNPVVRDYLVNAYAKYINMGVDAFRWDTIKHMDREDVIYFFDAFKAINPDLFIFGEVAQKRHELHPVDEINPHWYTWRGAVNNSEPLDMAVIDFYAEATFHGTFEEGQSFSTVRAAARYDNLYSDPSTLVTWLDNHDFGPNNDWNRRYGGSDENLAACMNFMFTWRGIPAVYYGTEMRFKAGEFNDIHNSEGTRMSIDETGRAYYGDIMNQAPSHPIYQHIKKLNAIRKAIPALQKGAWSWRDAPGNAVAYRRTFENSEVAVGLAKDGNASFSISGMTNGIYRDAVTGREIGTTNGVLNFTVTSNSAGIYVLNGPGAIGECGAGFFEGCADGSTPVVIADPDPVLTGEGLHVYFQKPSSWSQVNVYYWNPSPDNGSTPNWPGILMSNTGSDEVYEYLLDGIDSANLIFSDGGANKTDDLSRNSDGWYVDGIWYDSNPFESTIPNNSTPENSNVGDLQVYFQKPSNWSQVNIYYWNGVPNGNQASQWPGPLMTDTGSNAIYEYTFENTTSVNLIFSDGGANKSDDLTRSENGWYINGAWSNTNPFESTPPSTDSNDDSITIHYKGNLTSPTMYYWNTTPTDLSINWPGVTMEAEGNGWYKQELENVNCTNIIFNSNGSSQTADLSRCGDGWYFNGTWFDANPEQNSPKLLESDTSAVTVYPNPWTSNSIVSWNIGNQNTEVVITLSTIIGQTEVIHKTTNNTSSYSLELLAEKPAGIYFISVSSNGNQKIMKIIKQ